MLKTPKSMAVLLLLVCAALLPYLNTFKNDFVGYDDQNLIQTNKAIKSLSPEKVGRMFIPRQRGNYQPLRTLSYALDYAVWGMRPFGFHLTSIILHVLTVVGVWLLFRILAPDPEAALAAVIFAVHPIHVESVTWMSARKDVLCLFFFLAAILLYERSESKRKPAPYIASILATGLALLSKLTAASIPVCIFLLEICREDWPPSHGRLRRLLARLAPHVLVVCLIVGLNFVRLGAAPSHGDALAGLEQAESAVTRDIRLSMPLVVCRYVGLVLAPYNLSTHYDVARISNVIDPRFLLPAVFLAGMAAIGVICFIRGRRLIAFWLGWAAVTFLPTSNLIPAGAMMTDRYMHIPSIGFAALIAMALLLPARSTSGGEKSQLRQIALLPPIIVVLLFSTLTIRRNTDWRDTGSLFSRTLMVNPRSVDAHLAIAAMHVRAGELDSEIDTYQKALEIDPNHYRILFGLGLAYKGRGWLNEAIQAFEKSLDLNPDFRRTRFSLAVCYHKQKRYVEAIAQHRELLRQRPGHVASRADLGRIYAETGEPERALQEFNRVLEIAPDMISALLDRADLLIRQGAIEDAERDLRRLEALGVDTKALRAEMPGSP